MSDRLAFEIPSPSRLWPNRDTVLVGLPDNPAESEIPAQHATVSRRHILWIEPLGSTVTVPSA
jgi:hypothetical protein